MSIPGSRLADCVRRPLKKYSNEVDAIQLYYFNPETPDNTLNNIPPCHTPQLAFNSYSLYNILPIFVNKPKRSKDSD